MAGDEGVRQSRIDGLILQALQLDPSDRHQWLIDHCEDREIVREAEARLAFDVPGLFETPLVFQKFPIGTLVAGRFEIIRQIGAGGMGEVYEALDRMTSRHVALKTILDVYSYDRRMIERFLGEVRIGLTVTHPNLVRLYDVGYHPSPAEPETVFLTMELLRGKTLATRITEGPLDEGECEQLFRQLANGMAALHERNIVHRDLKTNNVLLTSGDDSSQRRLVITDFGLAQQLSESRVDIGKQSFGAPDFIAPEVRNGEPATRRSDIYSLGVILYEMLTGERPRHGSRSPAPSLLVQGLSHHWDRACLACLADNPEQRPDRVSGILEIVEQDRRAEERKKMRRKIAIGAVVSAALLGLCFAGALTYLHSVRPSGEARRWYERGAAAIQDANYFRAMRDFEVASSKAPHFALAHARRADAAFELEYFGIANAEMLKARPEFAESLGMNRTERAYLDAIDSELRQEFTRSADIYGQLAENSRGSVRLEALLAQSRMLEKDKQIDPAIKAAEVARAENPESPSAALRLGSLLGGRRERAGETMLKEAERLYLREGNIEGQSEAILRLATVVNGGDRPTEAQSQLNSVIQLTPRTGNEFQHVKALLQLSRLSSSLDHPEEGSRLANEAIELAQENDIEGLAASAKVDLGNAELVKGQLPQAVSSFRGAREAAMHWGVYRVEARANLGLSQALMYQGMDEDATQAARAAMVYWRSTEERSKEASALSVLTEAYCDLEQFDQARGTAGAGLSLAKAYGKPEIIGMARESLGTVAADSGEYAQALAEYEQAAVQYSDPSMLAWNAKFRADMYWRLGRFGEAEQALAQAESGATRDGDSQLIAEVEQVRCEMELSRREAQLARRSAEKALTANGLSRPARRWELELLLAQSESPASLSDAERRARTALANIEVMQNRRVLRLGYSILGHIFVDEHRAAEGQTMLEKARAVSPGDSLHAALN